MIFWCNRVGPALRSMASAASAAKNMHGNAKAQPQSDLCYECDDEFRITVHENWTRPSLPIVFTSAPSPRRKLHDKVEDELPRKPDRSKKDVAAKPKEDPNVEPPELAVDLLEPGRQGGGN